MKALVTLIGAAVLCCSVALAQQPFFFPLASIPTAAGSPCGSHSGQLTSWNVANAAITLSNSNWTASYTVTGSQVSTLATSSNKHTGKWYFLAHVDATALTNAFVIGAGNGSASLNQYPGNNVNSVGGYVGNWITQGPSPQGFVGPAITSNYAVIAVDLDNNRGWFGTADAACSVSASWSGPSSLNGNPSTNTNGIDISSVNDGVSVMPMWGGFQGGAGTNTVTLYTNVGLSAATLAGFKRWDAP